MNLGVSAKGVADTVCNIGIFKQEERLLENIDTA